MTVAFKTFGCRLNRAEALDLEAALAAAGHVVVPIPTEAAGDLPAPDWIVVRGCSVTARAQHDCEKEIARLAARFPGARIWRTGCLPGAEQSPPAPGSEAVPMSTSRAYLKVQDGCGGRCAFCIVPQFRGPPASAPFDLVLERARAFIAAGYRELVVTGCNLAMYRDSGRSLPQLLAALAAISPSPGAPPAHRVRLGSIEPGICDDALLDVIAAHQNICRFLHISVQSADDSVLRGMRRPYSAAVVARLCERARKLVGPRLALGADVIAGFPGETDSAFRTTVDFLERTPFTHLHVFPFSKRPGTPAAAMPAQVPRAVRLERAHALDRLAKSLRASFAQSFVGGEVEVCVEKGGLRGFTSEYLPCRLTAPRPRRSLVKTTVRQSDDGVLLG